MRTTRICVDIRYLPRNWKSELTQSPSSPDMVIGNLKTLCKPKEINEFVIFPSNPAKLATLSSGCYLWYYPRDGSQFSQVTLAIYICLLAHLAKFGPIRGKISAQAHTIVKQICFPNGNVLFLSLLSLSKNWMHNEVRGCAEISPNSVFSEIVPDHQPKLIVLVKFSHGPIFHYAFSSWREITMTKTIHCHWENRFVLQ